MKLLPFVILLSVIFGACHDSRVQAVLDAADREMFKSPDSAVIMLDSLDVSGASEAQRARHALLLTKARVKAHIIVTDTTLINSAVKYYSGRGDSLEMQSLFYHGVVLKDSNKYSEALVMLMDAADLASSIGDDFHFALSCREQAGIYTDLYEFEQALDYNQKAIDAFIRCNRPFHAAWARVYQPQSLTLLGRTVEAYDSIKALEHDSLILSDSYLRKTFYEIAGTVYYKAKAYEEAEDIYNTIIKEGGLLDSKLLSYMANVKLALGHDEQAIEIYEQAQKSALTSSDSVAAQLFLSDYYVGKNDYKKAYHLYRKAQGSEIVKENSLITHPYTALVGEYYQAKNNENEIKASAATQRAIMYAVFLCLVVMLLIASFIIYRMKVRQKRLENDVLLDDVRRLRAEISMLLSKQDAIKSEKSFSMAWVNAVCEARNAMLSRDDGLQRFGKNISDIIFELTSNKNLSTMETLINATNDNLMERFMAQVPDVSERERKVAIFIFLGFSNTSIAAIMQYKSTVNVRQVRHKLKNKILANPTADSELFLSYIAAGRTTDSE